MLLRAPPIPTVDFPRQPTVQPTQGQPCPLRGFQLKYTEPAMSTVQADSAEQSLPFLMDLLDTPGIQRQSLLSRESSRLWMHELGGTLRGQLVQPLPNAGIHETIPERDSSPNLENLQQGAIQPILDRQLPLFPALTGGMASAESAWTDFLRLAKGRSCPLPWHSHQESHRLDHGSSLLPSPTQPPLSAFLLFQPLLIQGAVP